MRVGWSKLEVLLGHSIHKPSKLRSVSLSFRHSNFGSTRSHWKSVVSGRQWNDGTSFFKNYLQKESPPIFESWVVFGDHLGRPRDLRSPYQGKTSVSSQVSFDQRPGSSLYRGSSRKVPVSLPNSGPPGPVVRFRRGLSNFGHFEGVRPEVSVKSRTGTCRRLPEYRLDTKDRSGLPPNLFRSSLGLRGFISFDLSFKGSGRPRSSSLVSRDGGGRELQDTSRF